MQRNRKQIEEIKTEMLELLSNGLTRKDILGIVTKKHGVVSRTFDRYWTSLMKEEESKLFKTKSSILVSFIKRHENMQRKASINFHKTNSITWWNACHDGEIDFMKLMATIGVLNVKPQELEITWKARIYDALEKARQDVREGKTNIP
jgi:hypothetical protein